MRQKEIWKNVVGFQGYQVSNYGKIKSLSRYKKMPNNKRLILPEKIMSCKKVKKYNCIKLCKNGKHYSLRICRLVGLHFIYNRLKKPFINHKDTDKGNDYFKNLEWVTGSENMKHAYKNGLLIMPWGNKKTAS